MNPNDIDAIERSERRHRDIGRMLDTVKARAVAVSDNRRLAADERPFPTVLKVAYQYQGVRVELTASVAWMPHLGRYEATLFTQRDTEVITVEEVGRLDGIVAAVARLSEKSCR